MNDEVKHPSHYTSHPSGVECIEITGGMDFLLGNAFKYVFRGWNNLKHDGTVDLEKALEYLNFKAPDRKRFYDFIKKEPNKKLMELFEGIYLANLYPEKREKAKRILQNEIRKRKMQKSV
jgi:hypothetical protein